MNELFKFYQDFSMTLGLFLVFLSQGKRADASFEPGTAKPSMTIAIC
jgi:hypothetical protein